MGLFRSLGYNLALGALNRRVREAQDADFEAIPASEVASGDHLLVPEFPTEGSALPLIAGSIETSEKRLPGLGLVRFGLANSKLLRISATFEDGTIESIELPARRSVLRRRTDADDKAAPVAPAKSPATPPSARTSSLTPPSPPPPRPAEAILAEVLSRSIEQLADQVRKDLITMEAWLAAPTTKANTRLVRHELRFTAIREKDLAETHQEMKEAAAAAAVDVSALNDLVRRHQELVRSVRAKYSD